MDQLINVGIGVIAVILGFFFIWALILGLAALGQKFKAMNTASKLKFSLSPEDASEVKESIEWLRAKMKAEKAATK